MAAESHFHSVLAAAQTGADWALTTLYRDLHPSLRRFLVSQEPADGEDLASEVWLDVAHGLSRFEGDESAFRCWLFTIARRRLIDLRRTRARRRTTPVSLDRLIDRPDPAEAFAGVESGSALACLAALPRAEAEIVLLRVVAGLDSSEVAAVTGRKPGTVRVMQKRALERLAELVSREARSAVTR
jgi:RNA polymerase sigma-70 factor (ECF subfamily)